MGFDPLGLRFQFVRFSTHFSPLQVFAKLMRLQTSKLNGITSKVLRTLGLYSAI